MITDSVITWQKRFSGPSTPFEDRSSNSSVESEGYRTLYPDNNDGKGAMIPPLSILRMRVEKEEMSFSTVHFLSKSHQHKKFKEWAKVILAQSEMSTRLNDLGIKRKTA